MDFEIEGGDSDEETNVQWNSNKSKSSFFATNDNTDQDYYYDFQVDKKPAQGNKRIPVFSPAAQQQQRKSINQEDEKPSKSSNESALERAQNMLNKYSKPLSTQQSNFKTKIPATYDEDNISIPSDSEVESGDFEMSESMGDRPSAATLKQKVGIHPHYP